MKVPCRNVVNTPRQVGGVRCRWRARHRVAGPQHSQLPPLGVAGPCTTCTARAMGGRAQVAPSHPRAPPGHGCPRQPPQGLLRAQASMISAIVVVQSSGTQSSH